MKTNHHLRVEKKDSICVLTIDREQQRNSMNIELLEEFEAAFKQIEADKQIRAVIIQGSGSKVFAAGADLKEAAKLTLEKRKVQIELGHAVFNMIEHFRAPVIAAINGHALGGGCELALACDIRIIEEHAKIGLVEVGIGTIAGWGGTQRLAKIVGLGIAKEMIFSGIPLTSTAAKEYGLVNRVMPSGQGLEAATNLAEKIASNGPLAVTLSKTLVNQSSLNDLKRGIELEKKCSDIIFASHDRTEGIHSFLEKRKPTFIGE
ncbi:enoyl-CoA hydratase/isomerase family protein [Halalkalibacter oceani]|uniref:enoyl-CoA hydratase/isomerase family protein n=1 Tax=Halalkalibacter oceani TaxID=1653776 RepID=UPI00339249A8